MVTFRVWWDIHGFHLNNQRLWCPDDMAVVSIYKMAMRVLPRDAIFLFNILPAPAMMSDWISSSVDRRTVCNKWATLSLFLSNPLKQSDGETIAGTHLLGACAKCRYSDEARLVFIACLQRSWTQIWILQIYFLWPENSFLAPSASWALCFGNWTVHVRCILVLWTVPAMSCFH